jgi:hypothetical protein
VPLTRIRAAALLAIALLAHTAGATHRRALLIGINDYTASHLPVVGTPAPNRDWPNLAGAVNDVNAMRELLPLLHAFESRDVAVLTDQSATRAAILAAAQQLAARAEKEDVVFFYFAGHGAQVRNSLSDEPDKLDESIIPADSCRGAADIRDKELRRIFNAILDRGAHLTILIDACHSGSGARGLLTAARPRGVRADLRDVRDGAPYGPRPENRGALVITASHDDDNAWEMLDPVGGIHGAFTWAWMRAMRDAMAGEPAIDTFTRAQARLRAERPYQSPVIAGSTTARLTPFLGTRASAPRTRFAVERVRSDGRIFVSGGWAHGLSIGSELRLVANRSTPLTVIALLGLARCEARAANLAHVRSGALVELTGWASAPSRPLRVSMPSIAAPLSAIAAFARAAAAAADARQLTWVVDPTTRNASYLLRPGGTPWELLSRGGGAKRLANDAAALQSIAQLPRGSSLFVQLPASNALVSGIGEDAVIERVAAEDADFVLTGRFTRRNVEYAWVRPNVGRHETRMAPLPVRSVWITDSGVDTALALRERALRLHKIQAWSLLESPPLSRWPYDLVLRGASDQRLVANGKVAGGETYALELQLRPGTSHASRRHVYVFTIDSYGQSTLLFPVSGSVENHFPLVSDTTPPPAIRMNAKIEIEPPYGTDTYMLLTTDEPLADPSILQWDGVRGIPPETKAALERLLALTSSGRRGTRVVTPATWSIEHLVLESVPPRRARKH